MRLILSLALLGSLNTALWATPEEAETAAKIAAQATEFLDSLLGSGRAKILVTVEGEHSQIQTQTEIVTPVTKPDKAQELKALPGYAPEPQERKGWDFLQKDQEQSSRTSGLIIKRLRVSVVLDVGLSEDQVNAVRRLLPDLLHIDSGRGDEIAVLRAPLIPPWKSALQSPEGIRAALIFSGASLLILLVSVLAYVAAMRLVRAFVSEIAARRSYGPPQTEVLPQPGALTIPDILPGGIPSLTGESGEMPAVAALGRRFDFLSSHDPSETAKLMSEESPEDIALLFGYLANSNPDLATSIFAALPAASQTAISQALAKLHMADPERLAMLENRLKNLVEFGLRGPERLGKILSRLPTTDREGLIGDIMSSSPEAAEEVGRTLFTFENIAELKPNELRRLITTIPYSDWGVALRSAPTALVDRVLEQLLAGTRALVREAMETPQPRNKVLSARSKILSQAYVMAARGELSIGQAGTASELI